MSNKPLSAASFGAIRQAALEVGGAATVSDLAAAYACAPYYSEVVTSILETALSNRNKPETLVELAALQAAQNQILIEQNAQILEALKRR